MTSPIPLHPVPQPRETLYSFASRFAHMNGVSFRAFLTDLGIPFAAFLKFERAALSQVGDFAGLTDHQIKEMISWSGIPSEKGHCLFRGEDFVLRAVNQGQVRGCPVCLREDAKHSKHDPLSHTYLRGDWGFREVRVCTRHSHPLVPLWQSTSQRDREDIPKNLRPEIGKILEGELELPQVDVTDYDRWLDNRLSTGTDTTWLSNATIYSAATFCRLMGKAVSKGDITADHHLIGFNILKGGKESFVDALQDQIDREESHNKELKSIFGGLFYRTSAVNSIDLPCFGPFVDVLREVAINNWPFEEGDIVYGKPVAKRVICSVETAAREIGVPSDTLALVLEEAGLIKPTPRVAIRRFFKVKDATDLLEQMQHWVDATLIRKSHGLSPREFDALVAAGFISAQSNVTRLHRRWVPNGLASLIDDLETRAVLETAAKGPSQSLLSTQTKTGVSISELVQAITDGRLPLYLDPADRGFSRFQLKLAEVRDVLGHLFETPEEGWVGLSEFGRMIGIREAQRLKALSATGTIKLEKHRNPKTGVIQEVVTRQAIENFLDTFTTPKILQSKFGGASRSYRVKLEKAGLHPLRPEGRDIGTVYEKVIATEICDPN
ncbi:hypothetical protein B9057_02640 [Aestuarium zhoushanense]|nr:hypothetical protein B9057_02640 [Aestuarium zhoushanense]